VAIALTGAELVARLGPHPARRWGLDLGADADLARWLPAACLLAVRQDEEAAGAARAALAEHRLDAPDALARAGPAPVAKALAAAGYPKPEITAARLVRASTSLLERHAGSLAALLAAADGLAEAGAALVSLAPGLGPATAAEILRPLRERFAAACEIPLAPAARAAAVHVGLLRTGEDEEGEPGALRAALAREHPAPDLADVEAALGRLGRAACHRRSTARCPLGPDCPALRSPSD
jgi:endonuclease III